MAGARPKPKAKRGRRGAGTHYYSAADKCWIARYPLGIVDGKRRDKRVRCPTEYAALDELDKLRRAYGAGGEPARGTLGEYLAEWLPAHSRSIRKRTAESYEQLIRCHIDPVLGGIPLGKLAPRDVRRLLDDLERKGLSAGSIHLVVRTLSAALNRAVAERAIMDNATRGVRLPRIEREPVRALTHADADAILDAVERPSQPGELGPDGKPRAYTGWLGPIIRLLLGSGIRLGEACGLDQRDLLLDSGFIRLRITKTRVRAVPISDDAVAALREALAVAPRRGPDEPVFFGPRANQQGHRDRLRGWSVTHALPRVLEDAGIGHLAPHALRHGAATLMLADGAPMRVISEQLGHSNPSLTARVYAHVVPEAQRAAVHSLERRRKA